MLKTHNKQLQRTVTRRRGDGASAPFHYALAPRFKRQRAAAELRRYAPTRSPPVTPARVAVVLACLLLQVATVTSIFGQDTSSKRAVPTDPIATVVDAFDSHRFVAILVNGFEEEHRFRLSLLNDPRFVSKVDDIVVEFGDARYQDVMDRFIAGDEVPYNELKQSWQQTTQPHHVSDAPIYEEFFRAVRAANDKLPEQERIRVLLADPPIDWTLINDFEDLLPLLQQRMPFEAGLLEREVLSKNRRALLLFAAGHVLEESPLVAAIRRHGQSLFKIWTADREDLSELEPSIMSWPTPSIALVKGTILGTTDLRGFYMENAPPGHFEDQFDAILYLGPPSSLTYSEIAPELCSDDEYLSFRIPRLEMAAQNGAPGWLAEFKARCASVGSPVRE